MMARVLLLFGLSLVSAAATTTTSHHLHDHLGSLRGLVVVASQGSQSHHSSQQPVQYDQGLYQAYYYFCLPVAVILSFLSSATVLRRVLRNKPRGLFSKNDEELERDAHGSSLFFDTLVSRYDSEWFLITEYG